MERANGWDKCNTPITCTAILKIAQAYTVLQLKTLPFNLLSVVGFGCYILSRSAEYFVIEKTVSTEMKFSKNDAYSGCISTAKLFA